MILLCLTGSVATVLYEKLIVTLKTIDPDVQVIMTERAYHFIHPRRICSLATAVYREKDEWIWNDKHGCKMPWWEKNDPVLHIELHDKADMMVIAPITANTMGKICSGVCDNLLTSVVRAWDMKKPLYMAPAMNTKMWEHPVTEKQIHQLKEWGYHVIPPQEKLLACGEMGMGAMANISDIIDEINYQASLPTWNFPLEQCNGVPIDPHPGSFGYSRRGKRHTGVDLYTQEYARVTAVEDGKVVCIEPFTGPQDNSPWWNYTECVLVEGASGVVCYGEIKPADGLEVGMDLVAGDYIGTVMRVIKDGRERYDIKGWAPAMLHMELYPHGTTEPSEGFEDHLQDPTPYILKSWNHPLIFPNYRPS